MILSDGEIREELMNGRLVIKPICEDSIQPASVDVRIGNTFAKARVTGNQIVDLRNPVPYSTARVDEYVIYPGEFVLATTQEYFCLPDDLTAFVEGRSSIGRAGLFIQNAGWVDPGFCGEITLEIYNAAHYPIMLRKGMRVGQMVFARTGKPAESPYRGKYQGQMGATGSMIYKDFKNE